MRLFAENPEQWEALRADPEGLAPKAVWEALRVEPITPFTARIALEDIEFRDVLFPEGTVVMVAAASANRDGVGPAFDITAERDVGKPLTFGAGPHYCLGANLAQAEMQEGLRFFAERMPGLALDGEPEYGSVQGVYGLDRLPLRWSSACRARPSGARGYRRRWCARLAHLHSKRSCAPRPPRAGP